MKRYFILFAYLIWGLTMLSSCVKSPNAIAKLKKTCLYNDKIDYFKKWANTFTEIDTYSGSTLQNKSVIYPNGYFKLNSDFTYNVFSDNVPLSGKWTISDSCQLVLDSGTLLQRSFDVLKLSNDSLTLRRKDGNTVYIQHYAVYNCPDPTKLECQWDNVFTLEQSYNSSSVYNNYYIYPVGYFKLNNNFSYNVLSDGVPLDGQWEIDPNGCKLVLDKNTPLQRSFDIQTLTMDSLTIWRKDTTQMINYIQHYAAHH